MTYTTASIRLLLTGYLMEFLRFSGAAEARAPRRGPVLPTYYAATLLGLGLLLGACSREAASSPDPKLLASTSFEEFYGWLPANAPALTQAQAHSGKFSTMVGAGHEFSLGYNNMLSGLAPQWPGKLKISAWVFIPDEQATAQLVAEVKSADATKPGLLWEGVKLTDQVKAYGQWRRLEHTITLPATARPDSRLLVYLWEADQHLPVYLDDMEISLADQ